MSELETLTEPERVELAYACGAAIVGRKALDIIDQQAARIAELEALLRREWMEPSQGPELDLLDAVANHVFTAAEQVTDRHGFALHVEVDDCHGRSVIRMSSGP